MKKEVRQKMKKIDMSTSIAGVPVVSFVGNACGVKDTTLSELHALGASDSAIINIKTTTLLRREGNPKPSLYISKKEKISLQSNGLENPGIDEVISYLPELQKYGKPIHVSVYAVLPPGVDKRHQAKLFRDLVEKFQNCRISLLSINFSCPNLLGGIVIGYDMRLSESILMETEDLRKIPFGIKLPQFNDRRQQYQMAKLALTYKVNFLTLTNSAGCSLDIDIDTEAPVMKAGQGFGGVGGKDIFRQALGNVRAFYENTEGKIDIIGCGGIFTGKDAYKFLLAGASFLEVGTAFLIHGYPIFKKVNNGCARILAKKGCRAIGEKKGKMKPYPC